MIVFSDKQINGVLIAWGSLLAFSAVMVGSAAVALEGTYLSKHLFYLGLGVVSFAIAFALPPKLWNRLYFLGWVAAVGMGVLVLIPGLSHEVNGASRWIRLGGFTIQAAEVAKFGLCIYLAGYLYRHGEKLRNDAGVVFLPLGMVAIVCVLLVAEPDLGSAVVIMTACICLLFLAGAQLRYFLLIAVAGALLLGLLILQSPYRLERLIAFLDPWSVQYGSGYQLTQALIAFGRGEIWGLGLGEGVQKLFYLPEAHTDFIFAVIAEELGAIGAILLVLVLSYLTVQILLLGRRNLVAKRRFAGFLAYFFGLVLAIQLMVSLGVNTGVLPTKGLTLPFVSYGGNSLLVFCALLGLVLRTSLEPGRD
ncbi:MAG: putative lipid II flippase FtsW [Pseudomonadales bacterium]|nr:putative lipid II flippase FtsW [Pseudomonadales bacterium]